MLPEEKERLLGLFETRGRWCQGAEAHDVAGQAVRFDDESAVAWDLTGGLCRLFGWRRACQLFVQLDRHINGKKRGFGNRDESVAAMSALFEFNDATQTTHDRIIATLAEMPVWSGPLAQPPEPERDPHTDSNLEENAHR